MFLFVSCSSVTKNMVKQGEMAVAGGVMNNQEWGDLLSFKRISWFKELTLNYDILYTPISKDSRFYAWFSPSEKRKIESCQQVWLLYNYSLDTRKVSHRDVLSQLKEQGFDTFPINHFHRQLSMHPNFEYLSMQVYKPQALCMLTGNSSETHLIIPGFKSVKL
jgi:hypothetical protein